jgi:hypothetical protein
VEGLNRYSYSNNNPTNYTDPSGHMASECSADGNCGDYTDADRAHDAYQLARDYELICQAGHREYCSYAENHPVEAIVSTAIGLALPGVVEYAIAGGGAATAIEVIKDVGWQLAKSCSTSSICWRVIGAGGTGVVKAIRPDSNQIGRNGENQVLKTLNDPSALTQQTVAGNGFSGRIDILTDTGMHEVKNVADISLSQRFMEQAYRYTEIAQANSIELHYWLLNDHPQYVVDWLSRLGIIVH